MSAIDADYPGSVWDGFSTKRASRDIHRGAQPEDWDAISAEMIATQTELDRLKGEEPFTKRITIDATAQKACKTSPVELIAAPGAGIAIIIEHVVMKQTFLAAAFAYNTIANISYTDESGAIIQGYAATFLETTATAISAHSPTVLTGEAAGTRVVENAPVVFGAPDNDPTTGDGTLVIDIRYRLLEM